MAKIAKKKAAPKRGRKEAGAALARAKAAKAATKAKAAKKPARAKAALRTERMPADNRAKALAQTAAQAGATTTRNRYDWNTALNLANTGKVPPPPDFSAPTHARYRAQMAEVVENSKLKDADALRAMVISTTGSSGIALDRFRKLCVVALAKAGA